MTRQMKKQTAANNALLKKVKQIFNSKIYKQAVEILNKEGEVACLKHLSQYAKNLSAYFDVY